MTVVNAIMIGITGIMSIPLLKDFFPQPKPATTTIVLTPGLVNLSSFDGENKIGGNFPNLALFDANGGRIGFRSGQKHGKLKGGKAATVSIQPFDDGNNKTPEYLSISASGGDAFCLSYLAVSGPNGEYWTWNGEFGKKCDQAWYASMQSMIGKGVRPKCIWFSNDGRFPTGIGLHLTDFSSIGSSEAEVRAYQYENQKDTLCKSKPRQHFYKENPFTELNCIPVFAIPPEVDENGADIDPMASQTDGVVKCDPHPGVRPSVRDILTLRKMMSAGKAGMMAGYGTRKRQVIASDKATRSHSISKRTDCDYKDVVISEIGEHSATELCQSASSSGPDFVSMKEGLLCDMCTHQLLPLCSETISTHCFDLQKLEVRSDHLLSVRSDGAAVFQSKKQYVKSINWA